MNAYGRLHWAVTARRLAVTGMFVVALIAGSLGNAQIVLWASPLLVMLAVLSVRIASQRRVIARYEQRVAGRLLCPFCGFDMSAQFRVTCPSCGGIFPRSTDR